MKSRRRFPFHSEEGGGKSCVSPQKFSFCMRETGGFFLVHILTPKHDTYHTKNWNTKHVLYMNIIRKTLLASRLLGNLVSDLVISVYSYYNILAFRHTGFIWWLAKTGGFSLRLPPRRWIRLQTSCKVMSV